MRIAFAVGDLVEVDAGAVRAVARIRESSTDGRLHVAFEMGQYLPWVDTDVEIRHKGDDIAPACFAKIIHAGANTALLQLTVIAEAPEVAGGRAPYDTIPTLD